MEMQDVNFPRVVMLGDSNAGKTSIVNRLRGGNFDSLCGPTIAVGYTRIHKKKGMTIQLLDTAGQERFRSITKMYYRNAEVIILTYDISSPEAFKSINYYLSLLDDQKVIIVANKTDLVNDYTIRLHELKLEQDYPDYKYEMVSAKSGTHLDQLSDKIFEIANNVELKEPDFISHHISIQLKDPTLNSRCCT